MNDIGGEPAGGDFVAFLDQLQKRQLHALAATDGPTAPIQIGTPSGSAAHGDKRLTARQSTAVADALLSQGERDGRRDRLRVPALALAGFGAFLIAAGLSGDFSIVPTAIGAWLLLVAGKRLLRPRSG